MLTIQQAEAIRKAKGLTTEQFSIRLGYSSRAYPEAIKRNRLSRWMAKEISHRFGISLSSKGNQDRRLPPARDE
jgi:transcriptional regulator with XRE-family HTH domain